MTTNNRDKNNSTDPDELFSEIIGRDDYQRLIIAESEDWIDGEDAKIMSENPVNLADWQ